MKAAWNTSIASPRGLTGPPLPVIGLPGILVITNSTIRIIVPPIPIKYHGSPHFLIIGKKLRLKSNTLGAWIKCKIPAIAVVAAAA